MDVGRTEKTPPDDDRRFFTTRRIAALVALALLALGLRRRFRFVREVVRHRRRLQLAFSILLLLRKLRRD
jgi:MYXO-CTERM domain-containing protein